MTTTYPGGVDDFAESSPTNLGDVDSSGRSHSERHDDVESAVVAVESTLGVNPQGLSATVGERIGAVEHGLFFGGGSPRRVEAERLLSEAVWWVDAADSGSSSALGRNLGWGGSGLDAVQATSGNQPKYLAWEGENYVYLPGVAGNYLSVPDEAALDITGDIDIRVRVALDDWTPASASALVSKYTTANGRAYEFGISTSGGAPYFYWTPNTDANVLVTSAGAGVPAADGEEFWVRVTLDVDNGSSQNVTTFYTSSDGVTWTQLGSPTTKAGTTSIANSADAVSIGARQSSVYSTAKIHRAQVLNGIDGTPVLDVDCSQITSGADTSFTARTGQQVSINRSSSGRKAVAVTQPCWSFGTDDVLAVPDSDLLDYAADESFTIMAVGRTWNTQAGGPMLAKRPSSGSSAGYQITVAAGNIVTGYVADGTSNVQPTIAVPAGGEITAIQVADREASAVVFQVSGAITRSTIPGGFGAPTGAYEMRIGRNGYGTYADMEFIAGAVFRKALTQYEIELLNDYYQQRDSGQPDAYQPKKYVNEAALPVGEQGDLAFNETSQQLLVKQGSGWNDVVTSKSVLRQIPAGPHPAETLLKQAVWWIDANEASAGEQKIRNLGWGGSVLDAQVGSTTGADSNDPKYLDWTGENYVYLPGVASNYLSVPDEAALDITGDIDIRVRVAMDDWTPSATQPLVYKWTSGQKAYAVYIGTDGKINLTWSADGAATSATVTSSVAPTVTDGATLWLRATLDATGGVSGGYDVTFYTASDSDTEPSSWTQLGTVVSSASSASIFASTERLTIGEGAGVLFYSGKFYRAQVLDGINGTPVLDIDCSQITSGSNTSFTALTGQTVTINRSTSGRKTVGVTHPCWLFGTDDYMEVPARWVDASSGGLFLPGVSGNYASTPDSAAVSVTGDLTIDCYAHHSSWRPSAEQTLVSKYSGGGNRSYLTMLQPDGKIRLYRSVDGAAVTSVTSTAAVPSASGALWIRVSADVDNGASGNDVTFSTSSDGSAWTQLGSTVTGAGATSFHDGAALLQVGAFDSSGTGSPWQGTVYRARIYASADGSGSPVFDADFTGHAAGTTSFTEDSTNAATVTINTSGTSYRATLLDRSSYVFPVGAPVPAAVSLLDFGADESFTVVAAVRQWATPVSNGALISKSPNSGTVRRWQFYNSGTTAQGKTYLRDESVAADSSISTAAVLGATTVLAAVIDRDAAVSIAYADGVAGNAAALNGVGDLTNSYPLRVGAYSSGTYTDMETFLFAVFRRALTEAELLTLTEYLQGRAA